MDSRKTELLPNLRGFKLIVCVCMLTQTLCDSMDCRPTGSSIHGIFQARIQSGLPCPPPGDLPDPEIEPMFPVVPALPSIFFTTEPPVKPFKDD